MGSFWLDLKYSWRLLAKAPGYSVLCVAVVALSVGLAMWSSELVYVIALKALPFEGAGNWLSLQIAPDATSSATPDVDAYTYQEVLKHTSSIDYLGAFSAHSAVFSAREASTTVRAAAISPSLLGAMRVAPLLGRIFTPADGESGAVPTGILSYDTWQNYFASDPSIVGKEVRVDGQPVRVIGVMRSDFFAFRDFELFLPLNLPPLTKPSDSQALLTPIILLRKGQSAISVRDQIQRAVAAVNKDYPTLFNAQRHADLFPANRMLTHDMVQFVTLIAFIALAVLLLGGTNVSMVFFARLLERRRELALRTALGSSRWRLLRQCLLETLFIVVAGLILAVGLAALGTRWADGLGNYGAHILATGRPGIIPQLTAANVVIAVIAATGLWLLSTLIPAWRIAHQDTTEVLGGGSKGVGSVGRTKSAGVIVGLQVLVSSLVLVICANMVAAVRAEVNKSPGVSAAVLSNVWLSTYPTLFGARYSAAASRLRYWDDLKASIDNRVSGTEVAYSTAAPTRPTTIPVSIDGRSAAGGSGTLELPVAAVSDSYFPLLGIQLRSGRFFEATDDAQSQSVALIDESLAAQYWPGQSPLGKRIQLNPKENGPWLTVIGVTAHVGAAPYSPDSGIVYRPLRQAIPDAFHVLVKLPIGAVDTGQLLRQAAYTVDPDLPLLNPQRLGDYLAALNNGWSAAVTIFTAIAVVTLVLAASGLFGLIMRSVARRTQEIGIRRALGGTSWRVTTVFLKQGAVYLGVGAVGIVVGIMISNLLSDAVSNMLQWALPMTCGVLAVMTMVIASASYLPTRKAIMLEPGDALRYE